MNSVAVFSAVLSLMAGIGIFLIACQMMSSNLESVSSNRLKSLFSKASNNKWLGVGIGTLGTAAIQSSGATTVMVIGFVNAGIVSLTQAATIIYGANIGTTVTAQIVALGMFGSGGLSSSIVFSSFVGVGAFLSLFSKRDTWKKSGGILAGFGMLFVGLSLMSASMSDFANLDSVKVFLSGIRNELLLVLIGAVFTAIIQSSSVMTSIAIAMVMSGLINLNQGIFLTMGSNIGSCVVALIAGLTSGVNAKRTALIHLFFNVSGVVVFLLVGGLMGLLSGKELTYGTLFARMFPGAPQTQLAMFHTIFNVCTVLVMLPVTGLLVNLVSRMISDKEGQKAEGPRLFFIDRNMLKTPPVAVEQTKREIVNMAAIAMRNFNRSIDVISTLDFSQAAAFEADEKQLNYLNRELIDFVVKLSEKSQLSEADHVYLSTTFRSVRDLERIGDYAENITEYAENLRHSDKTFSDNALLEIAELRGLINRLYDRVMAAYTEQSLMALNEANEIEDLVDAFTRLMEDNHIRRLSDNECSPEVGAQYLSLSSNAERVADHLINVGKSIVAMRRV